MLEDFTNHLYERTVDKQMFYSTDTLEELPLDEITKDPTFLEKLITDFNWESLSRQLLINGIRVVFTLLVFFIIHLIAKWLLDKVLKNYLKKKNRRKNRQETVFRIAKNVYHAIFYFFLIYTILDILNFPVGSLLASAGVAGLALSLGAQGFVADLVNGMTILTENQLDIGDVVTIEDLMGTVMNINLRTTQIKDFDGTIHYIPNREILIISNLSKGDMRAMIEVNLFHDTDLEKVRSIVDEINERLVPEHPEITVPPKDILFVSNLKGQLALRVIIYTEPGAQWGVTNKFFETYIQTLSKANIDLPYGEFDIDFER